MKVSLPAKVERLVLVADICSSTLILQHLINEEREVRWYEMLSSLLTFLEEEQAKLGFETYKFIGDGWILLFDKNPPKRDLFDFLSRWCTHYEERYKSEIESVISAEIAEIGMTFGLERGRLMRFSMNGRSEYAGRALNVAARLQASIRYKDKSPQGKVMMSNKVYEAFSTNIALRYRIDKVKRRLRNIGDYRARKLWLFEKSRMLIF